MPEVKHDVASLTGFELLRYLEKQRSELPSRPSELKLRYEEPLKIIRAVEKESRDVEQELNKVYVAVPRLKRYVESTMSGRSSPPPPAPIATIGNSDHELVDLLESSQWPAEKKAYPRVRELIETLHSRRVDLGHWENHRSFIDVLLLEQGIAPASPEPTPPVVINPRGAGRRPDPDVARRREILFEFFKEQGVTDRKEAIQLFKRSDIQKKVYRRFDEAKIPLPKTKNKRWDNYNSWTEVLDDPSPLDSFDLRNTIIRSDIQRLAHRFGLN